MTCLQIQQCVPVFAKRLLRIGTVPRSVFDECQTNREKIWFSENEDVPLNPDLVVEKVDEIIFSPTVWELTRLQSYLDKFQQILDKNGRVAILFQGAEKTPWPEAFSDIFFAKCGWARYHSGVLNIGDDSVSTWVIIVVHETYNPVRHAQELADFGRPDYALCVLDVIPDLIPSTAVNLALFAFEKQRHLFTWQQLLCDQGIPLQTFFTRERRQFSIVTSFFPYWAQSYHVHSNFWSYIGRDDMAIRTLRSIEHASPNAQTQEMIRNLEHREYRSTCSNATEQENLEWKAGWPVPRVLIITHSCSDYGLDTLYDGLCEILGENNVVEYPWKPTLHGRNIESANNYPCVFNYSGSPLDVDELVAQLKAGRFNIIVYADVVKWEHQEAVRRLMNAAPDLPVVVYDTWDDSYTPTDILLHYIDRTKVELIFKREMLEGVDYGKKTYPLPFGYPGKFSNTSVSFDTRKNDEPFWAGNKVFGLRQLYIRSLEKMVGHSLDDQFDQATYKQKLQSSLIGLSFFGFGFDTVRYWELPANAVMLLAERPPIQIPYNFVDGVSAVFFNDLSEMEAKLEYYLKRPEEAAQIAAQGHIHYLKYHTTTARARRFLGIIFKYLWSR